jgi:hypothetical protein
MVVVPQEVANRSVQKIYLPVEVRKVLADTGIIDLEQIAATTVEKLPPFPFDPKNIPSRKSVNLHLNSVVIISGFHAEVLQ